VKNSCGSYVDADRQVNALEGYSIIPSMYLSPPLACAVYLRWRSRLRWMRDLVAIIIVWSMEISKSKLGYELDS